MAPGGSSRVPRRLRVALLTREYPPDVRGGAGVHAEFLARELRLLTDLEVHCWAPSGTGPYGHPARAPRAAVHRHPIPAELAGADPALRTLGVDLVMAAVLADRDVVHSNTWYTNLAGHLAKLLHGTPHVMTAHSLEPMRTWEAGRSGSGYAVSAWAERTAVTAADAVVAVSHGMRRDVLTCYPGVDPARVRVIHNGIDTELYRPTPGTAVLERHGIDPGRPAVVFVGRTTRQKGVPHLLRAARDIVPGVQLVLCAGSPDTEEIDQEFRSLVAELRRQREGVFWIPEVLPRQDVVHLLTHATVFACPSVYEPLGIVNLEAMACGTPVVASAVGGIPEVVDDGRTGLLVPYRAEAPAAFEAAFAAAVNSLVDDPAAAAGMGREGRRRAVEEFGWDTAARRTVELYEELAAGHRNRG